MDLRTATTEDLLAWRDRIVADAAAHFEKGNTRDAIETLRLLEFATVDEKTLELTDPFLRRIAAARKLVATFDTRRAPRDDEIVIIYGNYPHIFANVAVNNPMKRHVADFWKFRHDRVEYDHRWHGVDRIFVINADDRCDRYDSILRELASARAPFERVIRIPALKVNGAAERPAVAGTIGCLRSHVAALRAARAAALDHALVMEDDFCFTSELESHLTDLQTFFERKYDYWVCLLATSKYGAVEPRDDVVATSFQRCTNAAGYLVSRAGIERLLPLFEDSLTRLTETHDTDAYAADRCWRSLQPSGKFLVFRRKFGFQGSSFSDIERSISRYLD